MGITAQCQCVTVAYLYFPDFRVSLNAELPHKAVSIAFSSYLVYYAKNESHSKCTIQQVVQIMRHQCQVFVIAWGGHTIS